MELTSLSLAFLAGLVSIFSPCVLPVLPLIFGTAVARHRLAPAALAAGLALSFLVLGLFVATLGFSLGLDAGMFRTAAAIALVVVGVLLASPLLQERLASAAGPISRWASRHFGSLTESGLGGQFALGLLLGAAWAPCVGPTLGAASVLAAQGRDLGQVGLTMFLFAVGTALPLLALGLVSREALARWRGRMLATGRAGKLALGLVLATTGALILTGYDRSIEAGLVMLTPAWLTDLTTRF